MHIGITMSFILTRINNKISLSYLADIIYTSKKLNQITMYASNRMPSSRSLQALEVNLAKCARKIPI